MTAPGQAILDERERLRRRIAELERRPSHLALAIMLQAAYQKGRSRGQAEGIQAAIKTVVGETLPDWP